MAKPILVIQIPHKGNLQKSQLISIKASIVSETNDEYHVLVIANSDCDALKIEAFNPDVIKPEDTERLLKIIENEAIKYRETPEAPAEAVSVAE